MGTPQRQPGQGETKSETCRYLTAAEYFLRQRDFHNCRKYALRARDSDPTNPGPALILPIVSVLSAPNISPTHRNYYYILNLRYFEQDAVRIESSYESLASILNPNANHYPFSAEAFDLVLEAWAVLSDHIEKVWFDNELRRSLDGCTSGSDGGTFWTMCPYCYYVYEYDRGFEDCSLRCVNERCRRVLHAVAIGEPPPPEVVEKGYYWCAGFIPLTIRSGNDENLWVPFASPIGRITEECDHGNADTVEAMALHDHGNCKKAKFEGEASNSGETNGFMDDGVNGNGGGYLEAGFGGETSNDIESGVEFFEGDDDVFVGLQCDLDLRNGNL